MENDLHNFGMNYCIIKYSDDNLSGNTQMIKYNIVYITQLIHTLNGNLSLPNTK